MFFSNNYASLPKGSHSATAALRVPTPPTSGSSFSRYLPSFLRKAPVKPVRRPVRLVGYE